MSHHTAAKLSSKISAPTVKRAAEAAAGALAANAPRSVLSIPSSVRDGPVSISDLADENGRTPSAVIRQIGATRRIFILDPYMNCEEIEGLTYRIRMLGNNKSLNSILLSNNAEKNSDDEVDYIFPASALETDRSYSLFEDESSPKKLGDVWHAAGGYDTKSLLNVSSDERRKVLNSMMKLTLSIRGSIDSNNESSKEFASKIPFISVPHGLITDGGYALAMGSYVLATTDSRFKIMNPLRGLSLDPVGLSYVLPRLGWEFHQPSAHFPVGSVLALTGYEADDSDMIETGLATHFIDSYRKMGTLERSLAELPPYDQQILRKDPIKQYGKTDSNRNRQDVNTQYRNVAVANLLDVLCTYDAAGQEFSHVSDEKVFFAEEDPSLVLQGDKDKYFGDRESLLVNIAATFEDIFKKENTVVGILERLKEHAGVEVKNEEDKELASLAKELVDGMEAQSPLALHSVHKLMNMGKNHDESLESCMERERNVLLKLFEKDDYKNWAASGAVAGEFKDWKHNSVAEVTSDEINELFAE